MSFAGALASLAPLSAAVRHNRLAYHADKAQGGSSPGNNNNRLRWLRASRLPPAIKEVSHAPPFSPEVLDDLATAFKDVWATLYAQVPPDDDDAARLSGNLSRTLVALAVEGITDPKELRRKAIENMILTDHQAR